MRYRSDIALHVMSCKSWIGVYRTKLKARAVEQNKFGTTYHGLNIRDGAGRCGHRGLSNVYHCVKRKNCMKNKTFLFLIKHLYRIAALVV